MASNREIVLCRYRYDPLDRLAATAPLSTTAFQRFYCKSRLATEIHGQIKHSIFQHDDQLLAQQQSGADRVETTLLATDQQRSVLHAFNASPPQPIAYSPYGHRPADCGLLSLLEFNGERRDPVTGHYLLGNGYRAFNPVLMRFNSPDSWSPFGDGGLNPYAYCLGDPINRNDQNGHISLFGLFIKYAELANKNKSTVTSVIGASSLKTLTGTGNPVTSSLRSIQAAVTETPMGLFENIQGMPHITEKIIRHLPADDLIALASTSKQMNNTVYSAAIPVSSVLGDATTPLKLENNLNLIRDARSIASGDVRGMLPAQLNRTGINPNYIPMIEETPGYVSFQDLQDHFRFYHRAKVRQSNWRINHLYNRPHQH